MTAAASWLLVLSVILAGNLLAYALCRMASRMSRHEEHLHRRREIDDALEARRVELRAQWQRAQRHRRVQRGVKGLDAVEVPPPKGAA